MLDVLLVEDDADIRAAISDALRGAGYKVTEVSEGAAAIAQVTSTVFDVVLTDVRLPKASGIDVFRATKKASPRTEVILMTSFANVGDAVAALKEGAYDYLTKPVDLDEIIIRIGNIAKSRALVREVEETRARLAGSVDVSIIGSAPLLMQVLERAATVAMSDAAVLVTGESGTGKELVARRLHARSARASKPFIAINCAAFPETLLEAELFGHERGAFTGAIKKRHGRFKAADGGTLFLDEVSEIPPLAQAKLLRVLQEGIIEPLGTNESQRVDVRIVSASNRDLKKAITDGRFREDLYYRLNVVRLHLPPLRDRPGDLPILLHHFLARFIPPGERVPEVSIDAWRALTLYPFPGNVREFEHAIKHAVILARGGAIEREHLPEDISRMTPSSSPAEGTLLPLARVIKDAEREHLLKALAVAQGKRVRAAELLGISRKNLWEKLSAHQISDSDFDDDDTDR
jgi:DNA-binding NtrC family response regulator